MRDRFACLVVFFASCVTPAIATAAPLAVTRSALAQACLGSFVSVGNCSIGGGSDGGLDAQLINTYSGSGDTLSVSATGDASFGILKASANASYSITGPATNAFAAAGVGFIDIITISYAPWDGLPGLLNVSYNLDGTVSSSGTGTATSRVVLFVGPNTSAFPTATRQQDYNSTTAGVFSIGAPLPFTYGQPFVFDFSLFACAGEGFLCNTGLRTGIGAGNADFSHTLVLSGLVPTDLAGVAAGNAQFTSTSGTQYSVYGVTPEPGSLLLLGSGIAVLARRTARRYARNG